MADIAIITAVYDHYDNPGPVLPQDGVEVDWVFVTDDLIIGAKDSFEGWRVVHEPHPGIHPNRAAKNPKFLPWEYTDAPASVWIDASFRVTSPGFAAGIMEHADPIAQFVHPWRDCIYTEAEVSESLAKYSGEPLSQQAEYYRACGHPERWGLWAAGVIGRRHTPEVQRLGAAWMHEVNLWSFQDQVSQPYVLRKTGLRPSALPGTHFMNDWVRYEGSGNH